MLPECYIGATSLDDIRMRLCQSIVMYKGNPTIIVRMAPDLVDGQIAFKMLLPSGTIATVPINDPDLSCDSLGTYLGHFQMDGGVGYSYRTARRQFTHGLNTNNTGIGMFKDGNSLYLNQTFRDLFRPIAAQEQDFISPSAFSKTKISDIVWDNIPGQLLYMYTSQGFHDMWHNKYMHWKEALEEIDKQRYIALSRQLYMSKKKSGEVALHSRDKELATLRKDRWRYHDKYVYLSQSVERQIGMMPV